MPDQIQRKKAYYIEVAVKFSADEITNSSYAKHTLQESDDLFLLCARLQNTIKAESPIPIAADFRLCSKLKELAREHDHPDFPCFLEETGKYSCGVPVVKEVRNG